MSLVVSVFFRDAEGRRRRVEGAPSRAAGFERWRVEVWGSEAVRTLLERSHPETPLLVTLRHGNLVVEHPALDQLEREVETLLARAAELAGAIQLDTGQPLVGSI